LLDRERDTREVRAKKKGEKKKKALASLFEGRVFAQTKEKGRNQKTRRGQICAAPKGGRGEFLVSAGKPRASWEAWV